MKTNDQLVIIIMKTHYILNVVYIVLRESGIALRYKTTDRKSMEIFRTNKKVTV